MRFLFVFLLVGAGLVAFKYDVVALDRLPGVSEADSFSATETLTSYVEPDEFAELKEQVALLTPEPDQAQFRDVGYFTDGEGDTLVCGKINAKNRLGGFNGFTPFSVTPLEDGTMSIWIDGPSQHSLDRGPAAYRCEGAFDVRP